MLALYAATLLIAPGALITCTAAAAALPSGLRLAATFALSPLVLSAELVASAAVGMSFAQFMQIVVPFNLIGLALLVPFLPRVRIVWSPLLVALTMMLPVVALQVLMPELRTYGWHNLMQMAAIEQINRLPSLPEEADLSGFRLNYPWLGYAQIAVLSAILDRPATWLFPLVNVLHFLCLFGFLSAAAAEQGGGRRWSADVMTALVLLSPGAIAVLVSPTVEGRIVPMTSKYLFLDSMVFGLTAYALLVYAVLRCLRARDVRTLPLIPLAALACGIGYPLLFPSCLLLVCVVGVAFIAPHVVPIAGLPRYSPQTLVVLGAACAAVASTVFGYLLVLGSDAGGRPPIYLTSLAQLPRIGFDVLLLFAVTLALALPAMRRLARPPDLVVVLAVLSLIAGFMLFHLPLDVQYKFLFGALLLLTPVIAGDLSRRPLRWIAALAVVLAAVCAITTRSLIADRAHVPGLDRAVPLAEDTARLHPRDGWEGSWMEAVRDRTPADTVLLDSDSNSPVAVFTNRATYIVADGSPMDLNERASAPGRVGYTMTRNIILHDVKNYPAQTLKTRLTVLAGVFDAEVPASSLPRLRMLLAELHRPLAIHFTRDTAFRQWLHATHRGTIIWQSGVETVRLVMPGHLNDR